MIAAIILTIIGFAAAYFVSATGTPVSRSLDQASIARARAAQASRGRLEGFP